MRSAKVELEVFIKFILVILALLLLVVFIVGLGASGENIGDVIRDIVRGVL